MAAPWKPVTQHALSRESLDTDPEAPGVTAHLRDKLFHPKPWMKYRAERHDTSPCHATRQAASNASAHAASSIPQGTPLQPQLRTKSRAWHGRFVSSYRFLQTVILQGMTREVPDRSDCIRNALEHSWCQGTSRALQEYPR